MYQALYRKWRPQTFSEVSGQPHITQTLLNELRSDRVSHAYLFTGSRGTGKTSCAKILAKAVNCLSPVDGEPCGKCELCRGIDDGSVLDVLEIDAASNNGVDNIRDIREEVNLTPYKGKYRVYIIDEVHMLSTGAFNALLKTLEEPPSHVIFILATTEVHKLPATVLSRCQRFDFKRISPDEIAARLMYIADGEGINLTPDGAALIARLADGGMRDAVSLLDRCCARGSDIDSEVVSNAAGIAGTRHLFEFSKFIAMNDSASCIALVNRLHNEACDIESLCSELTVHFRNLMISKTVRDCSQLIICSSQELAELRDRASSYRLSRILHCLDIIEESSRSLKGSTNKKIILESAVIKMCETAPAELPDAPKPQNEAMINSLLNRIEILEKALAGNMPTEFTNEKITDNISTQQIAEEKSIIENQINEEDSGQPINQKSSVADDEMPEPFIPDEPDIFKPQPIMHWNSSSPEQERQKTALTESKISEPIAEEKPVQISKPEPAYESKKPVEHTVLPAPEILKPAEPEINQKTTSVKTGEFEIWPEVLDALKANDMPLFQMLMNTTAYIHNDGIHLVIRADNPQLDRFISTESHALELRNAAYKLTGQKFKLAVANQNPVTSVKKNPLENLKSKINEFNS